MADNKEVNQDDEVSAADIPDLKAREKEKEKERKKAGAAWSGAKPSGSFSGASGGAGNAARSAASAGGAGAGGAGGAAGSAGARAAAAGAFKAFGGAGSSSGFFATIMGRIAALVGGLAATAAGKVALAAAVGALLIAGGAAGFGLLGGGGSGVGGPAIDLGALSSGSMKVRPEGGDRTGFVASSGLMVEQPKPADVPPPEAAAEAAAEAVPETPMPELPTDPSGSGGVMQNRANFTPPSLDIKNTGSQMTSGIGTGFGRTLGGDGFGGSGSSGGGSAGIRGGMKGRISNASRASSGGRSRAAGGRGIKAQRAFGQLKLAKGLSTTGAAASGEAARTSAAGAFEGGPGMAGPGLAPGGPGTPPGGPGPGSGPGGGPGGGPTPTPTPPTPIPAGGPTPGGPTSGPLPEPIPPEGLPAGQETPEVIEAIESMAENAGRLRKKSLWAFGLAAVFVVLAIKLSGTLFGAPLAAYFAAAAAALTVYGVMLRTQAAREERMAREMSESLEDRTDDPVQNNINQYCIERSLQFPGQPCNPPDSVTQRQADDERTRRALEENARRNGAGGENDQ